MPIFDYECVSCETKVEKMVRTSEDKVDCPICKEQMKKLIGASSFRLYGSGYYSPNQK